MTTRITKVIHGVEYILKEKEGYKEYWETEDGLSFVARLISDKEAERGREKSREVER